MEHDSSRSGYHEPEPGLAGREDEEDWGDDFPKTFSVNLIWAQACDKEGLENFLKKARPEELEITSDQLEKMREDLEIEISILFERFPLNQLDMLEDKEAIDFNLNRLKNVYEEYQEIYGSLGEELNIKIAKKETTS